MARSRKKKNVSKRAVEKATMTTGTTTPTLSKEEKRTNMFSYGSILFSFLIPLLAATIASPLLSFLHIEPSSHFGQVLSQLNQSLTSKIEELRYAACDDAALSHFLHEDPVDGLHVVCVKQDNNHVWSMDVFSGSQRERRSSHILGVFNDESDMRWSILRKKLKEILQLRKADELRHPWAAFTPLGERLVGENDRFAEARENIQMAHRVLGTGMIILAEGGLWQWPGVEVGFRRLVDLSSYVYRRGNTNLEMTGVYQKTVTLETVSLRPLVLSVEGFLSSVECEHIKEQASSRLKYSNVVMTDKNKEKKRTTSDFRTSQSAFLPARDDIIRGIDDRIARLVRVPKSYGEHVQVLKYLPGEKYNAHHDYFNASLYKNDPKTLRTIDNGRKNRFLTVLWYLSDVESGGETLFPRVNGAPRPKNSSDCSNGLRVTPQKGKVVIFYSLTASGECDELSMHTACAVERGEKWAGNKFVWNEALPYIADQ